MLLMRTCDVARGRVVSVCFYSLFLHRPTRGSPISPQRAQDKPSLSLQRTSDALTKPEVIVPSVCDTRYFW